MKYRGGKVQKEFLRQRKDECMLSKCEVPVLFLKPHISPCTSYYSEYKARNRHKNMRKIFNEKLSSTA